MLGDIDASEMTWGTTYASEADMKAAAKRLNKESAHEGRILSCVRSYDDSKLAVLCSTGTFHKFACPFQIHGTFLVDDADSHTLIISHSVPEHSTLCNSYARLRRTGMSAIAARKAIADWQAGTLLSDDEDSLPTSNVHRDIEEYGNGSLISKQMDECAHEDADAADGGINGDVASRADAKSDAAEDAFLESVLPVSTDPREAAVSNFTPEGFTVRNVETDKMEDNQSKGGPVNGGEKAHLTNDMQASDAEKASSTSDSSDDSDIEHSSPSGVVSGNSDSEKGSSSVFPNEGTSTSSSSDSDGSEGSTHEEESTTSETDDSTDAKELEESSLAVSEKGRQTRKDDRETAKHRTMQEQDEKLLTFRNSGMPDDLCGRFELHGITTMDQLKDQGFVANSVDDWLDLCAFITANEPYDTRYEDQWTHIEVFHIKRRLAKARENGLWH